VRTPPRIRLEPPAGEHARAFLAAVAASRRMHAGWVSPPDTRKAYSTWLERIDDGSHIGHLLFDADDRLAGAINLGEVIRGGYQSAYLGYYLFSGHEGRGLMREGLCRVLSRAFRTHGLNRIEARTQPQNLPSRRLLSRVGFRREGFAPRSLKIGGRWRDHELWALLAEEWSPARLSAGVR
jgi:ribosomal-protein-alanine N-acetyltransferase